MEGPSFQKSFHQLQVILSWNILLLQQLIWLHPACTALKHGLTILLIRTGKTIRRTVLSSILLLSVHFHILKILKLAMAPGIPVV